jgi:transposase-like protein
MAGTSPKFSDAQRNAIVRRVLVDQVAVTDSVRDAAVGNLDVEAFDVPTSTAQRWVREAREDRSGLHHAPSQPEADALDTMRARLWALHLNSLDELERRHAECDGDEMEQRAIHLLMLAAIKRQRELEKLTAHRVTPAVSPGAAPTAQPDPEAESFLERLSRESTPQSEPERETPTEGETALQAESISSRQAEPIAETGEDPADAARSRMTALELRAGVRARDTEAEPVVAPQPERRRHLLL